MTPEDGTREISRIARIMWQRDNPAEQDDLECAYGPCSYLPEARSLFMLGAKAGDDGKVYYAQPS